MEEKDKESKSSTKRPKTNEQPVKTKSLEGANQSEDQKTKKKEDASVDEVNEAKLEDESDYEEDPEEDPEEYEEMEDPGDDLSNEVRIPPLLVLSFFLFSCIRHYHIKWGRVSG